MMRVRRSSGPVALLCALAMLVLATPARAADECRWQASWGSSQMVAEGDNALPPGTLTDATLRQVVRISTGGGQLRIRLSNAFGREPLRVAAATVARSAGAAGAGIVPDSLRPLRFSGQAGVIVPPGAEWLSDPVDLSVAAFDDLAVSVHFTEADGRTTHPGSRATSYIWKGDRTAEADPAGPETAVHWFQLSGVEVNRCGPARGGIVALGDSITDGFGVTPDSNARWTDALARRLGGAVAVVNQGIGGNRLLADGLGPSIMSRLDRDVFSLAGIDHLILLVGVNDLGGLARAGAGAEEHAVLVERITGAYAQIAARARAHGIRVHGATILPFMGSGYYHPGTETEASRQAINAWLRTPGNVDNVVDFDAALRDPARPAYLLPAFDNDGLHPSLDGYRAMADAIDLSSFHRAPGRR